MSSIHIVVIAYAFLFIFIGFYYSKGSDPDSFHAGKWEVGSGAISASTFSLIGGGEFVTLTAFAYWFGWWALLFFAGIAGGFIVLGLLAKEANENLEKKSSYAIGDFFSAHFGKYASKLSVIIASVTMLALLIIQLVVGGQLLEMVADIPYKWSVIGLSIVSVLYIMPGGINSVLGTDKVQAIIVLLLLLVITVVYGYPAYEKGTIVHASEFQGIGLSLTLVLTGFFAVIGGADVWQRVLISKNAHTLRVGMFVNAIAWVVFGLIFVLLAMIIKTMLPTQEPEQAFFAFVDTQVTVVFAGALTILLLSAILSTADTELFALSSMLNREIFKSYESEPSSRRTKIFIIAISALASIVALYSPSLIDTYFILLYFMMILGPIILAKLLGRGTMRTALFGMVVGVIVLIWLIMTDKILQDYYPLLVLIAPSFSFLWKYQENESIK